MNTVPNEVRKHLITVANYHLMGEAGVFAPDARIELIDGEIFDMAPAGIPHKSIVNRLNERCVLAVQGRAIVQIQMGIALGELSEPEPDITLLRRDKDYYKNRSQETGDVLLVVEVADSSLRHDRDVKVGLYARHGIPEVWLIDVPHRQVHVHDQPDTRNYQNQRTLDEIGSLSPVALPEISIDLSGIF